MTSSTTPVNPSDTGTHRGNDRKVTAQSLRIPTHGEKLGSGRVMLMDTKSFKQGEFIRPQLAYALKAPDGRRVPILAADLHNWIDSFYKWPHSAADEKQSKKLYVSTMATKGMWDGADVQGIPLKRGTWTVLQSDEDFAIIPQTHTMPLEQLKFHIGTKGSVIATFPKKQNTPTAVESLATKTAAGAMKNTPNEGGIFNV